MHNHHVMFIEIWTTLVSTSCWEEVLRTLLTVKTSYPPTDIKSVYFNPNELYHKMLLFYKPCRLLLTLPPPGECFTLFNDPILDCTFWVFGNGDFGMLGDLTEIHNKTSWLIQENSGKSLVTTFLINFSNLNENPNKSGSSWSFAHFLKLILKFKMFDEQTDNTNANQ